jgi:pentapeptide repeat protein
MRVALVVVGCVVVGAALAVCVVFGPAWMVGSGPGLSAAERLKAENDVRSTLLQGLGGLLALGGVGIGAAITLGQVRANREGHTIDLFTKAIEQLASEHVSVRHGGIYALELLSDLDSRYRGHAHALLTAFIRQHAPWPSVRPEPELAAERARLQGGLRDDIGTVLGVLNRQTMIEGDASSVLEHIDLRDGELRGLNIPRLYLAHSNLAGAKLGGAQFVNADLSGTILRGTDLTGANLHGADLRGADLTDAKLDGATLTGVTDDDKTKWPRGFTKP